ncbi:MAG: glycosyltransferase family 39 protein [Anaerolineae bacterium]|nr:glycosyltransferase family 39 protein [Anaerolineae bacterium]
MGVELKRDNRWTVILLLILLMAFALRVLQLDHRPLWWDEGNSVYFAHQSLSDLVSETRTTNDTDPPVYRLALGVWKELGGSSPFALRFLSVGLGVLVVALTGMVGRWLGSRRTALLVALLVALSPMQVYYSREAKGYVWATVCGLLSVYAWGRGTGYFNSGQPSRSEAICWWVLYVLSTAAAIGAHYYLGLLVVWQGVWLLGCEGLSLIRRSPVRHRALAHLGQWTLAVGAVALLLLPWTLIVFGTTVRGVMGLSRGEALSWWAYLSRVLGEFCWGTGDESYGVLIASSAMTALAVVGVLTGERRAFLLTWVVIPLTAAYFLQRAYPFFFPRFLLYLGPVFYLLMARGLEALGRRGPKAAMLVLLLVVIVLWIPALGRVYTAAVDELEDPRPAMAHLSALAQPDDALVYVYVWQVGYLLSYYPQHQLSFYRAYFTPQTVGPELESIFATHPRLWLLSYRIAAEDAHNLSASWLEAEAYKVESNWYGRHHLALYLAPHFQTPGVGPEEGTAYFGGWVELRYPVVDAHLHPGEVMALPLRWRALTPLDEEYNAFVHLGLPGAPPLAQNDGIPQNGLAPTSVWAVGREVLDRRVLSLPDDMAPGRYQVTVGLYRLSDGSRLAVRNVNGQEGAVRLGYVHVECQ